VCGKEEHIIGRGQHGLNDPYISQAHFAVSRAGASLRLHVLSKNRAFHLVIGNMHASESLAYSLLLTSRRLPLQCHRSLCLTKVTGVYLFGPADTQSALLQPWWWKGRARLGNGARFTCSTKDTCGATPITAISAVCSREVTRRVLAQSLLRGQGDKSEGVVRAVNTWVCGATESFPQHQVYAQTGRQTQRERAEFSSGPGEGKGGGAACACAKGGAAQRVAGAPRAPKQARSARAG